MPLNVSIGPHECWERWTRGEQTHEGWRKGTRCLHQGWRVGGVGRLTKSEAQPRGKIHPFTSFPGKPSYSSVCTFSFLSMHFVLHFDLENWIMKCNIVTGIMYAYFLKLWRALLFKMGSQLEFENMFYRICDGL